MAIHQLINLDFTPGIKAEYINQNFELIKKWITNERLRIGGWGLVEGFDMTCDNETFTVNISEGIFINREGEEVEVPKYVHGTGPLDYNIITKTYLVDGDCKITLDEFCYDTKKHRYITYNPPTDKNGYDPGTLAEEGILLLTDPDGFYVEPQSVIGKNIWVKAENKGKKITVKQCVALDRIDSVMLHPDGTYEYLWSIDSPSPSHVNLGDYVNSFCVGVIYWTVDTFGVNSEIFTNHRSYRKIYVDKTNTLYINGEVYKKPKFIYFQEPDESIRELNDLWYDEKSNTLYIWRYRDGDLGWVIVNDHSEIIVKERKVWYPEDNPTDLKTFTFKDDEVNLYFVPGSNALDISIDCATLMDDMYEELIIGQDRVSVLRDALETRQKELKEKEALLESYDSEKKDIETLARGFKKKLKELKESYESVLNVNTLQLAKEGAKTGVAKLDAMYDALNDCTDKLENIAIKYSTIKNAISVLEEQIDVLDSIVNGTYVSNGYGFRLKRPLTHAAYVEVTVTHIVRMKPVRETFQRAAIFIKEGNHTVNASHIGNGLFETAAPYAIGNDQLEVYLNGIRLVKGESEFYEVVDKLTEEEETLLGQNYVNFIYGDNDHKEKYEDRSSQHFRVNKGIKAGDVVSYRVSKHVWSYDQLDALLKNVEKLAQDAFDNSAKALILVTEFKDTIDSIYKELKSSITVLEEKVKEIKLCYKHGDEIAWEDLPVRIRNNVVGMPIDRLVSAATPTVTLNNIRIEKDSDGIIIGGDIFQVYYIVAGDKRILVREGVGKSSQIVDYTLESSTDGKNTILELAPDLVDNEAFLYIVGFKRGLED